MIAPTNTQITANLVTPSGARVPPAWRNVWVSTDPKSRVQATGQDSRGRRVYLYSTEYMGRATAAKFSRLKSFVKAYPSLMKKIERDMQSSEEARVLYLIAKTGFRIGSNSETRARVQAYGASTLRCSHVSVDGNKLSFDFTGKKGIRITKVLENTFMAGDISRRCSGGTDKQIFRTTDDAIRTYLNSIQGDSAFMVKDFRTYLGTLSALRKIKTMPVPHNNTEFRKYRKAVGETVAQKLGNSPTIALKSYISPEVFCSWELHTESGAGMTGGKPPSTKGEFLACIHYDQEVSPQECIDCDPLEKSA